MKKYTIVIIGLVVMALVLGSCELQKGGTIRVTNENTDFPVKIYITKSLLGASPPTASDTVTVKTIGKNATGEISINKDGTYYIRPFFVLTPTTVEVAGIVDPIISSTAILLAGNIISVKVKMLIE